MENSAAQQCEEKRKRVMAAANLQQPDAVPLYMPFGSFAARNAGITIQEAYADTQEWLRVNEKMIADYQPDFYLNPNSFDMVANGMVGDRLHRWPGNGIGPNSPYQWVEGEYMSADEYDAFIADTGDFAIRKYLPRAYTGLEGLSEMPQLMSVISYNGLFSSLSNPAVVEAMDTLVRAAKQNAKYFSEVIKLGRRAEAHGVPELLGWGAGQAPFDYLSDYLRGMKGLTYDMFRCPEKVIAVQQKIIPFMINTAKGFYSRNPTPLSFGALHRGSDDFMSLRQFEKFYWPGLKQVMLAVIDAGIRPFMFFEGFWDQRLEYLKELPRGKVVGWFDRTDLFKAKKIIGNHMCICGGMPLSLLQTGTVQQVADYTKKLIDELAPDGGYIMGTITELDFARPELVKVWADVTREYGIYR